MSKWVSQLRIIAQLSNWSNAVVCNQAADEIERLTHLVNTPMFQPFDRAVKLEAAHQVNRWGTVHDRKKEPQEWFWLVGYLAGKALRAHLSADRVKALHHTISSAAVLFHWHAVRPLKDGRTGTTSWRHCRHVPSIQYWLRHPLGRPTFSPHLPGSPPPVPRRP